MTRAIGELDLRVVSAGGSRYATSHRLIDIVVADGDGTERALVYKSLSEKDLLPAARGRRPRFGTDPSREPRIYRDFLAPAGLDTAELLACDVGGTDRHAWILVEHVDGRELYQSGDLADWKTAARWVAGLHCSPSDHPLVAGHLPRYDRAWFERWPSRALAAGAALPASKRRALASVVEKYPAILERILRLPPVIVHGELYASNVLLRRSTGQACAVDWETAGIGPGLLDVAALVAGDWTDAERAAVAAAYVDARDGGGGQDPDAFMTDLACCELHLCLQWIGWSPGWVPPDEHAFDWLARAVELSDDLLLGDTTTVRYSGT